MSKIEMVEFDYALFKLGCGINALGAIQTAMSEGPHDPGNYVDALYCVHDYLEECGSSLKSIFESSRSVEVEDKS